MERAGRTWQGWRGRVEGPAALPPLSVKLAAADVVDCAVNCSLQVVVTVAVCLHGGSECVSGPDEIEHSSEQRTDEQHDQQGQNERGAFIPAGASDASLDQSKRTHFHHPVT